MVGRVVQNRKAVMTIVGMCRMFTCYVMLINRT